MNLNSKMAETYIIIILLYQEHNNNCVSLGKDRKKNICHCEKETCRKSRTPKHDTEMHIQGKKPYLYLRAET